MVAGIKRCHLSTLEIIEKSAEGGHSAVFRREREREREREKIPPGVNDATVTCIMETRRKDTMVAKEGLRTTEKQAKHKNKSKKAVLLRCS